MENTPSEDYINFICQLYGDAYDDRDEDSHIGGMNWESGRRASHKSIRLFQEELRDIHGINLSRSKIQKILVSGNRWSTERSREIAELYEKKLAEGMTPKEAVASIASHLNISTVSVNINLPYQKVVYALDNKSRNAQRIEKYRRKK